MGWLSTRARTLASVSFVLALTSACGGGPKKPAEAATESTGGGSSVAEIGKPAPDLSIQTLNGKGQISLSSLAGKPAIVDFWATWCGPCKKSFPKLEEIAKRNAGNIQLVGISVDDNKDGVLDFAKANGATFPIGWDDGHAIAKRWKVEKMPTTYVLDASGTVRFVHEAFHGDEGELIGRELALLASEPPPEGAKGRTENATASAPAAASGGDEPTEPTVVTKPKKKTGKAKPATTKKATTKKKKPTQTS